MVENGNFLRLKSATTREDDKENENNGEYDDCIQYCEKKFKKENENERRKQLVMYVATTQLSGTR